MVNFGLVSTAINAIALIFLLAAMLFQGWVKSGSGEYEASMGLSGICENRPGKDTCCRSFSESADADCVLTERTEAAQIQFSSEYCDALAESAPDNTSCGAHGTVLAMGVVATLFQFFATVGCALVTFKMQDKAAAAGPAFIGLSVLIFIFAIVAGATGPGMVYATDAQVEAMNTACDALSDPEFFCGRTMGTSAILAIVAGVFSLAAGPLFFLKVSKASPGVAAAQ
jgi:hypothetical protein